MVGVGLLLAVLPAAWASMPFDNGSIHKDDGLGDG